MKFIIKQQNFKHLQVIKSNLTNVDRLEKIFQLINYYMYINAQI